MPEVRAPVYSHVVYDIVPDEELVIRQPDILILEGLNVLQIAPEAREFVSDYFDFSIYIDAEESDIEHWYIERFLTLRRDGVRRSPLVLPPLRRPERGGGRGDGTRHLAGDQREEPGREHRCRRATAPR